jgi:hypothetical protein
VNEVIALVLILVLVTAGYAAGRLHGQFSSRIGYRLGYRQGYFDGDRSSWNRRRRELQAAVAAVLSTPAARRPEAYPLDSTSGTTYASSTRDGDDEPSTELAAGAPRSEDWALVDVQPRP